MPVDGAERPAVHWLRMKFRVFENLSCNCPLGAVIES